ncbi:ParA family protein [Enterococcus faecalis]|uniref:ParA family protein n=1 Tax=Enterococcus faecalis TaxID=1351 RepID=UPI0021E88D73|nr:ParA family protein [Enterococcus faecalis]MCV3154088.1 AAA family ATPase [Enterococcus faecalis]
MTKVLTTGNFKGGVGKTTNAVMTAYTLSNMGKNVLLVDFDPQANATELLFATMTNVYKVKPIFKETLFVSIQNEDISKSLIHVKENLDLLPSFTDLEKYSDYLSEQYDDDYSKDTHFNKLLNKIKLNYDFIIIDVPPQLNKFTNSALVASDYVIVVLQTQERSLKGAEKYIDHLIQLNNDYGTNIDILGLLPVLVQNGNDLDMDIIEDAETIFGKANIFKNKIKTMARLKRFDRTGITDNVKDIHDKRVHEVYENVSNEILERINILG